MFKLENVDYFARLVRLCCDLRLARRLHSRILQSGQLHNRYLANLVVEMYGRCGGLEEAQGVFDDIHDPNLFSWTIMLNARAQNGHVHEAREIFDQMPQKDVVVWNAMVQAHAEQGDLQEAMDLFERMDSRNVISWTTVMAAFSDTRDASASEVFFGRMPQRNSVSWNAMLAAYAENGQPYEAWSCFERIPERDVISWDTLLGAYDQDVKLMKRAFDRMPQHSDISCTVLISGFSRSNQPGEARTLFDRIPVHARCVILQSAMLEAYARNEQLEEAMKLFEQMKQRNVVSWNTMCGGLGQFGKVQHAKNLFFRMPSWSPVSWNVMLQALSSNGNLTEAVEVFDTMPQRTALSWTALLVTYAQHGHIDTAKMVFELMPLQNLVSWIIMVIAYARKGLMAESSKMFERVPKQDTLAWTSVVQAYALIGLGKHAMEQFFNLDLEGIQLDSETFARILNACSHVGLVDEALYYFSAMLEHGLSPKMEHYSCMVDVLGRAGRLNDADELLANMPFVPQPGVWTSLLGACRTQEDVHLGEKAAAQLFQLEPGSSAPYSLLFTIFAVS